jgi:hypothetical protein
MNIRVAIFDEASEDFSEVVDFVKSDKYHNFISLDGDWIKYKNPIIQDFFKEYYRISNNSKNWHSHDSSRLPAISGMSDDNLIFCAIHFSIQNNGFAPFQIKDNTKSMFSKDKINIVIFDTDFSGSGDNYDKVKKLWREYQRRSKLDSLF